MILLIKLRDPKVGEEVFRFVAFENAIYIRQERYRHWQVCFSQYIQYAITCDFVGVSDLLHIGRIAACSFPNEVLGILPSEV